VHRAARAGLAYAGWEAADRDALDAVAARLRAAGVAVSTPSADERAERVVLRRDGLALLLLPRLAGSAAGAERQAEEGRQQRTWTGSETHGRPHWP